MRPLFAILPVLLLMACGSSAKVKRPATQTPQPPVDRGVVNAPLSHAATNPPRVEAILGRWIVGTNNTSVALGKIGVLTFGHDGRVRARAGDARDSGSWRFEPDGQLRVSGLGPQTLMFQLWQVDANHLELIDEDKGVIHLSADRALAASAPVALIPEEDQPRR